MAQYYEIIVEIYNTIYLTTSLQLNQYHYKNKNTIGQM